MTIDEWVQKLDEFFSRLHSSDPSDYGSGYEDGTGGIGDGCQGYDGEGDDHGSGYGCGTGPGAGSAECDGYGDEFSGDSGNEDGTWECIEPVCSYFEIMIIDQNLDCLPLLLGAITTEEGQKYLENVLRC